MGAKELALMEKGDFSWLEKFLEAMFAFTDIELEALCGDRKMTYPIFKKCINTCIRIQDIQEFNYLLKKYPDFEKEFINDIDDDLKDMEDLPPLTKEQEKRLWEELKQKIRERFGENAI